MRKKERKVCQQPGLNMTPMIDVVFQLLIFFLVTIQTKDLFSHLDVSRLKGETGESPLLQVLVHKEGFVLQGRRVDLEEVNRKLDRVASFDKTVPVIIKCAGDSAHARLIQLLDRCAKSGMSNVSVFSM